MCRYPDTYRAGTPIARSITSVTCAKSWHTPSRACHASVAVEWTPVVPGWYFSCLFTHSHTASTDSAGSNPVRSARASRAKVGSRGV